MKENSDEDRHAADTRIDELLNSFIDGELTAAQQAEVQHLIAHDVQVARRLRQLQRCKMLVGSLPCAEVPFEVAEGIRVSLARMIVPDEASVRGKRAGKRHLLVRRVLSAAAMIGLVAVLATVIYTILTPQAAPERPVAIEPPQAVPTEPGSVMAASLGFSGCLELKTTDLAVVSTFVNRAIEDRGLADTIQQDRHIYSLTCNSRQFNALLADLDTIWPQLASATLFVNTEVFGKPVAVNNVTTGQIAQLADQSNVQKRIQVAKDFDAVNTLAARLPGREIASAIQGQNNNPVREWRVPKPILTSPSRQTATKPSSQPQETVRLTIVVNR